MNRTAMFLVPVDAEQLSIQSPSATSVKALGDNVATMTEVDKIKIGLFLEFCCKSLNAI